MIDANCPVCFGLGWVCENHPRQAWDEKLGCQWGRECGECQRASDLETPDVSKVLEGHDVQVERQQYSDAHNSHSDKKSTH